MVLHASHGSRQNDQVTASMLMSASMLSGSVGGCTRRGRQATYQQVVATGLTMLCLESYPGTVVGVHEIRFRKQSCIFAFRQCLLNRTREWRCCAERNGSLRCYRQAFLPLLGTRKSHVNGSSSSRSNCLCDDCVLSDFGGECRAHA
jgi:hypothetical protein